MELPNVKTAPLYDVGKLKLLIHGRPKVGKSTFCAGAPEALFIATEPGLVALETYQILVNSWEEFKAVCKALYKQISSPEGTKYKTIVIDTLDGLYALCEKAVCEKDGYVHPGDFPQFGKGWTLVKNEFRMKINALANLGLGLFLVSHTQDKEVTEHGSKITKAMPNLPKGAREASLDLVDFILYAHVDRTMNSSGEVVESRLIQCLPDPNIEAGSRFKMPPLVPLEFNAFVAAFEECNIKKPAPKTDAPKKEKK